MTICNTYISGVDPWVTGCGGTIVYSQPPPLSQATWNDQAYQGGATGGGVSAYFTNSADYPWQSDAKINGQPLSGRGVPDVAGNASGYTGYDIIVYGTRTSQLNASNHDIPATPAGTSAVAPLYAGLIALINANLFPNNITTATSVGFLNPTLYNWGDSSKPTNKPIPSSRTSPTVWTIRSTACRATNQRPDGTHAPVGEASTVLHFWSSSFWELSRATQDASQPFRHWLAQLPGWGDPDRRLT